MKALRLFTKAHRKLLVLGLLLILNTEFLAADVGNDLMPFWLMDLARSDPAYQLTLERFHQEWLQFAQSQGELLPQWDLEFSPLWAVSRPGAEWDSPWRHDFSQGISMAQNFPWGPSVNFRVNQQLSWEQGQETLYTYRTSASASVRHPLFPPNGLYQAWQDSRHSQGALATARLGLQSRQRLAEILELAGNVILLEREREINDQEWQLMVQESQADLESFREGRVTILELQEADARRNQVRLEGLRIRRQLLEFGSLWQNTGLDHGGLPAYRELQEWLDLRRSEITRLPRTSYRTQLAREEYRLAQYRSLSALGRSRPNLEASFSLLPRRGQGQGTSLPEALDSYWKLSGQWDWSMSLSLRLPLFPQGRSAQAEALAQSQGQEARAALTQALDEEARRSAVKEEIISLLWEEVRSAQEEWRLQQQRTEVAQALAGQGRISRWEQEQQQTSLSRAELAYYRALLAILLEELRP